MEHPWKSALVTGASSGIGEAFAKALAADGVDLVLIARRAERLESIAAALRTAHGIEVEIIGADLVEPDDLARVASRVAADDHPIDLLVNSAGVGSSGPFIDGDVAAYRRLVDLNVNALVALTHAAVPAMVARDRGSILNVSSLGGLVPGPRFAVYSASKAFVTSFSEALYEELRGSRVVVTVVCPGATHSEFGETAGATAENAPEILWQTADEVAGEALAACAKGRALRVTGGINRISAVLTGILPRAANRRAAAIVANRI